MGGDADAVANGVKIKEKFSCWCYFYLWIGISTRFSSFVLQLEWVHLPSSLFRLIKGSSSVTLMLTQWISWRYHPPPLHHLVIMIFNALQTLTYKLAMYVWYEYYVLPPKLNMIFLFSVCVDVLVIVITSTKFSLFYPLCSFIKVI